MRHFGARRLFVMIGFMSNLLLIFILAILAVPALTMAYNPQLNEAIVPYEAKYIDEVNVQTEYLGELKGDPHIYEFSVREATNIKMALMQLESESIIPLSLIIVKENEDQSGVSEIGRLSGGETNWQIVKDSVLGLTFNKSKTFEAELKPGIYRVEVSAADNYGKYVLVIGDQFTKEGYFTTLSDIQVFQTFFGGSRFSVLKSSYVAYPLGLAIIVPIFYLTWRQRDRIQRAKHD